MPLIAAVTSHQAEGRSARRGEGKREGVPSQAGSLEQGPTLSFPSQRGVPGQRGQAGGFQEGRRGGVAPAVTAAGAELLPRPCPFPPQAGSGSGGETEAHGCAVVQREVRYGARNLGIWK